ncbi:hypothetical protein MTO96_018508 [Rhipicephalus appendiculatus]
MDRQITVFGQNVNSDNVEQEARVLLARENQEYAAVAHQMTEQRSVQQYANAYNAFFHEETHLKGFQANHAYRQARLNRVINSLSLLNQYLDEIEAFHLPNGINWDQELLDSYQITVFGINQNSDNLEQQARTLLARENEQYAAVLNHTALHNDVQQYANAYTAYFHEETHQITIFGQNVNSDNVEEKARTLLARENQQYAAVLNHTAVQNTVQQYVNAYNAFFHEDTPLLIFSQNHAYRSARLNRVIARTAFLNETFDTIDAFYTPNGLVFDAAVLNAAQVDAVNSVEQGPPRSFSGTALCGLPPQIGQGLRVACTSNCRGRQPGEWCGDDCFCRPSVFSRNNLVCLPPNARVPVGFHRPPG